MALTVQPCPVLAVSCRLSVSYPVTYPAVSPVLTVGSVKGLSGAQLAALSELAATTAAASPGDCCVFQVSTALRDFLIAHNQPSLSMFEQMAGTQKDGDDGGLEGDEAAGSDDEEESQAERDARREKREAERRAARGPSPLNIPPGTLVTVESFTAWKARYDEEQRLLREVDEAARRAREQRLTGKQLFLLNLAKELQDDEAERLVEEKDDGAGKQRDVFWFSAGLYADEDVTLPTDDGDGGEAGQEQEGPETVAGTGPQRVEGSGSSNGSKLGAVSSSQPASPAAAAPSQPRAAQAASAAAAKAPPPSSSASSSSQSSKQAAKVKAQPPPAAAAASKGKEGKDSSSKAKGKAKK